ncbi:MAG: hypothetical protein R3301_04205 [Saprospiraceae bacterium]|nr:hypothetical protein [Saprospiraceae bacterium]
MSALTSRHIIRFAVVILLQGLILRRIALGGMHFNYISILFYPILLALLPIKTPRAALLLIGLGLGLTIDVFYDSLGVHASACVFTAFIRPWILQILEPRGGYPVNVNPTIRDFGAAWFMQYMGTLLALHLLFYFSVEVFTFVYIGQILLKTVTSFIVSFMAILIFMFLFNPRH